MSYRVPQDVTALLHAWSGGDTNALEQLTPFIFEELHRIARQYMARERPDHTLQPTALVNELYLRLSDVTGKSWHDRTHFVAAAAKMMRRILVDFARSRRNLKRGGNLVRVTLADELGESNRLEDVLAVDLALEKLKVLDGRKARIVELRYFGGLTLEETAKAESISDETVRRDWEFARTWLYRELNHLRP